MKKEIVGGLSAIGFETLRKFKSKIKLFCPEWGCDGLSQKENLGRWVPER